jgi:hypothetical protein
MKWSISLKNSKDKEIQFVLEYCKNWLSKYDTSKLGEIRINNGRQRKWDSTFYGHCDYPWKKRTEYKVVCHINDDITFPLKRQQRRSPFYWIKNGIETVDSLQKFQDLKDNPKFELGKKVWGTTGEKETVWQRLYELEVYESFDECIAAIFGHEISHFLSRTKQIKVHNTEIEIDKAEDIFLKEYKEYKLLNFTKLNYLYHETKSSKNI